MSRIVDNGSLGLDFEALRCYLPDGSGHSLSPALIRFLGVLDPDQHLSASALAKRIDALRQPESELSNNPVPEAITPLEIGISKPKPCIKPINENVPYAYFHFLPNEIRQYVTSRRGFGYKLE